MQPCFTSVAPAWRKCRASKRLLCLQSICIRRLWRLHCCKKTKSLQNYPLYDKLAITTTKWLLEVLQCVNLKIPNENFLLITIISMHQNKAVLTYVHWGISTKGSMLTWCWKKVAKRWTAFYRIRSNMPGQPVQPVLPKPGKKRCRSIKIRVMLRRTCHCCNANERAAAIRGADVAASTGTAAGAMKATSLLWTVAEASACTYHVRKWKLRHFINVIWHIYIWLYATRFDWTFLLTVQAVQV